MLTLTNPTRSDIQSIKVEAVFDTNRIHLIIPEQIRRALELEQLDTRSVTFFDGSSQQVPYVGPLELKFKDRGAFAGALVMGNRVLLGTISMDDMDIDLPASQNNSLTPKPSNSLTL